jgi:hypothetical protein
VEQPGPVGPQRGRARHGRWAGSPLLPALALAGALAGCTTVTVQAGDGRVTVERSFGFVQLLPAPGRTPMVIRSTSLGWQAGPAGQTLGFASARVTLLPAGCHLVLIDGAGALWPDALWQRLADGALCRDDEPPTGER